MDIKDDFPMERRTRYMCEDRVNEDGNELPTMNYIRREVLRMSREITTLKLKNFTNGVDQAAIAELATRLENMEDQMNLLAVKEERNQAELKKIRNVLEDVVHNGVILTHPEAIRGIW